MSEQLPLRVRRNARTRVVRWRVAVLLGVHLAIAVHVAHYLVAGESLAPLELNEVLHTLHAGIITAGFVFMLLAAVATVVFGRFFCGWGCHLLALQDLAAWVLGKLGWTDRAVRARALALIAPVAALYLFVWPEIERRLAGRAHPGLALLGDADGWGSFVTRDFFRNLPGIGITLLTFAVCGVAIVALLGSRAFCRWACPYGVVFRILDRVAPKRIVLAGDCIDCGACSAVCTSHVAVDREVRAYGQVVDAQCLKDMDCVAVCPTGALQYATARRRPFVPALRPGSDYGLGEELAGALILVVLVLVYRGLYDAVPFLLALGMAAIGAVLAMTSIRIARHLDLTLAGARLRVRGRMTAGGRAILLATAALAVLTVHSGFVRVHAWLGERALDRVRAATAAGARPSPTDLDAAMEHLETAAGAGLVVPLDLERRLLGVAIARDEADAAVGRARRILAIEPGDGAVRAQLARALEARGDPGAEREALRVRSGPAVSPDQRAAHALALEVIADVRLGRGDRDGAVEALVEAVRLDPARIAALRRLASLRIQRGEVEAGLALLRACARLAPRSARVHDELGVALGLAGRSDDAQAEHRRAVALDPRDGLARTNLAVHLANRGRFDEARTELRRALAIDPDDPVAREAYFALGGGR